MNRIVSFAALIAGSLMVSSTLTGCKAAQLLAEAPVKQLRPSTETRRDGRLLILGIDGLIRDVIYDELRAGRLPGFDKLLGGREGKSFAHAYFHPAVVAPFPSVTAAGWSALLTGKPAGANGVTGNEMLLRPEGRFVAPVPMSVSSRDDLIATYTDQLFGKLLGVPTIFTRLEEQGLRSWVVTNHVHIGAERLLLPGADDFLEGAGQALMAHTGVIDEEDSYSEIDDGSFGTVLDELAKLTPETAPNVLMVYASGTDLLAHIATRPVGDIQRQYLRDQLDKRIGQLADALAKLGAWHVVLTADHGHTTVTNDDAHALTSEDSAAALALGGFTARKPSLGVDSNSAFSAVVAPQSGAAFVYLADRSQCVDGKCRWDHPPRYEEDVLVAADAFWRANGGEVPALKGTLDMILVRRPAIDSAQDKPFVVYQGKGKPLAQVSSYLAAHPNAPAGPLISDRLHHLAVGHYGDRAGDVLVVAKSGETTAARYYFGKGYGSTHGAARDSDSFVPLIVAHPERSAEALAAVTQSYVAAPGHLYQVGALLEHLALGRAPKPHAGSQTTD